MITILTALLLLTPLSSFASKAAERIFKQYSPNIVQIESVYGTGTGFFVSEEMILTNRHVVFGLEEDKKRWNAPRKFILHNGREIVTYEFMICSKSIDICALRIDGGKGTEKILFSTREIVPGEDAFVIGHPRKMKVPVLSSGVISSKVSTLTSKDYEHKPMSYQGFTTNASISYGSSGSPVISKNGELLGVITSFMKGSQNLNIAVSSMELNKFLNDLNQEKFDDYLVMDPGFEMGFDKMLASNQKPTEKATEEPKNDDGRTDKIRKVLTDHLPQLRYCYQAELDKSGVKFKGEVQLKFSIGDTGSVVSTHISTKSGLLAPITLQCVEYVIRKLNFPAAPEKTTVEVDQSMNFFPKES